MFQVEDENNGFFFGESNCSSQASTILLKCLEIYPSWWNVDDAWVHAL
jgi:hypothetical protein